MRAYDKNLVGRAQASLARAIDYAVNDLRLPAKEFLGLFIGSGVAVRFEKGEPNIVAGKSGIELARLVVEEAGCSVKIANPSFSEGRSAQYWLGWSLAYYQWYAGISFQEILAAVSADELLDMYVVYHEMDLMQFVDEVNARMQARFTDTSLKTHRLAAGLTQNELAARAEVPKRTIQQYEQRQKDINCAKFSTIMKLSKALNCKPESLYEFQTTGM